MLRLVGTRNIYNVLTYLSRILIVYLCFFCFESIINMQGLNNMKIRYMLDSFKYN